MKEKTELKAIELVRHIRDEQSEFLAKKSSEEIIDFFHQAGAAAREKAHLIVPGGAGGERRLAEGRGSKSTSLKPTV